MRKIIRIILAGVLYVRTCVRDTKEYLVESAALVPWMWREFCRNRLFRRYLKRGGCTMASVLAAALALTPVGAALTPLAAATAAATLGVGPFWFAVTRGYTHA